MARLQRNSARPLQIVKDGGAEYILDMATVPQDIIDSVMKDEARLHSNDLIRLTYPRKAAEGRNKLLRTIRRIFVSEKSSEVQNILNGKDQERADAVRRCRGTKDMPIILARFLPLYLARGRKELPQVEANRADMEKRRVFNKRSHGAARRQPDEPKMFSSEAAIKALAADLGREVGGAKRGWMVAGSKAPAWVASARGPKGTEEAEYRKGLYSISVSNPERAMRDIDDRSFLADFVARLRSAKVAKKINWLVADRAKKAANK